MYIYIYIYIYHFLLKALGLLQWITLIYFHHTLKQQETSFISTMDLQVRPIKQRQSPN